MAETRISLSVIRQALDTYDALGITVASHQAGVTPKTIYKWRRRRDSIAPDWPTPGDIRNWDSEHQASELRRSRNRKMNAAYRRARYLNGGPLKIDATGTRRRVQALMRMGWSAEHIASVCGWNRKCSVTALLTRPTVTPRTQQRVAAAFSQLCMQRGPSDRTRWRATRMGWAPPLAWDNLDDVDERPSSERERQHRARSEVDEVVVDRVLNGQRVDSATTAERDEIARRWVASGRPLRDLAALTGWRPDRYYHIGAA